MWMLPFFSQSLWLPSFYEHFKPGNILTAMEDLSEISSISKRHPHGQRLNDANHHPAPKQYTHLDHRRKRALFTLTIAFVCFFILRNILKTLSSDLHHDFDNCSIYEPSNVTNKYIAKLKDIFLLCFVNYVVGLGIPKLLCSWAFNKLWDKLINLNGKLFGSFSVKYEKALDLCKNL